MSPSIVLSVKGWISKYSSCCKGQKMLENQIICRV